MIVSKNYSDSSKAKAFDETNLSYLRSLFLLAAERPVVVIGAGVTGRSLVRLLTAAEVSVIVVDEQEVPSAIQKQFPAVQWLSKFDAENHSGNFLKESNPAFAVLSPGVNPRGRVGALLVALGLPCLSELDITLPFLGMPEVAITGTNGKTTTVNLINEMLNQSGKEAICVGNVGTPFADLVEPRAFADAVKGQKIEVAPRPLHVAELSSYQLETVGWIRPKVAAILNVDDDHLERHGTLQLYLAAKARIALSQTSSEFLILPQGEKWADSLAESTSGTKIWIGSSRKASLKDSLNSAFWNSGSDEIDLNIMSVSTDINIISEHYSCVETSLIGEHNRLNIAVAIAAARLIGATVEGVQSAINLFKPLEHRIEFVRKVNGVGYINDSKGTNISAVVVALTQVADLFPAKNTHASPNRGNVHLLLGGKIKEGDWSPIREKLAGQVCSVIAFGGDRELILERLSLRVGSNGQGMEVSCIKNLEDALTHAYHNAIAGDVVLLSPGCASFDAYSDYKARGSHFRELVNKLVE